MEKEAKRPCPEPSPSLGSEGEVGSLLRPCPHPQGSRSVRGQGGLLPLPASVKHLLQVGIQEHSSGVQPLPDVTELAKGRVHFLKVLPGAIVGL